MVPGPNVIYITLKRSRGLGLPTNRYPPHLLSKLFFNKAKNLFSAYRGENATVFLSSKITFWICWFVAKGIKEITNNVTIYSLKIITTHKWNSEDYVFSCARPSFCPQAVRGPHVTITHDALNFTVQEPPLPISPGPLPDMRPQPHQRPGHGTSDSLSTQKTWDLRTPPNPYPF